jgi:hypothetical protein
LNFQRKISENIAELDNTLQGMLRGKERPLPTALKEYSVPHLQKKIRDYVKYQQCMHAGKTHCPFSQPSFCKLLRRFCSLALPNSHITLFFIL